MSIVYAIIVFGILIFIHELGHFLCAKAFKVKVNEFSLGMGPKLLSRTKGETAYSLRLLPIGGFVSMEGEDEPSGDPTAFNNKPLWQRIIVVSAGAVMNLLLGFLIMLLLVSSSKAIASTTVAEFREGSMSDQTGLQAGDQIVKMDQDNVHIYMDVVFALTLSDGEPMDIVVKRDGEKVLLKDVQFPTSEVEGITTSNLDFYFTAADKNVGSVMYNAFFESTAMVKMVWKSFVGIVTGHYGLQQLSGPVGTTTAIGQAASAGLSSFLFLMGFISINLGVVNLFPLPALDGGRLFFMLIELIRRKPINPKYEGYVHAAGFVLLMGLMVIITFSDIKRLLGI